MPKETHNSVTTPSKGASTTSNRTFTLSSLTSNSSTVTAAALIALLAVTLALFTTLRSALPRTVSQSTPIPLVRNMSSTMKVTKRPWSERGHADHGWLYSFHTFSFASYYDPKFESFGPLRVINEDRVNKGTGFGTHSHAEFLIWSYIVDGELEHKDSMGNLEKLRRGEVQFTSAGTGIRHSEYNRNKEEDTHFLQIWAKPNVRGLKPSYHTRKYTDEMKTDKLVRIVESLERHKGGEAENDPIPANADVSMSASILTSGKTVTHDIVADGERKIFAQVIMSGKAQPKTGGAKIKIGDVELGEGDGAFIEGAKGPGTVDIKSVGDKAAEFILFDMGMAES